MQTRYISALVKERLKILQNFIYGQCDRLRRYMNQDGYEPDGFAYGIAEGGRYRYNLADDLGSTIRIMSSKYTGYTKYKISGTYFNEAIWNYYTEKVEDAWDSAVDSAGKAWDLAADSCKGC